MAHACRVLSFLILAGVTAQASFTVSWNTRPSPAPTARPVSAAVQGGQVVAVHGTQVVLRLRDGSMCNYTATPDQARILGSMLGARIRFRVQNPPR